jgi:hypothetical protein
MDDKLDFDFRDQLGECGWDLLASHQKLGNLYIVERNLSLSQVGKAFKEDSIEKVKNWMEHHELRPPLEHELEKWANKEYQNQKFQFMIVQPFVLAQVQLQQ